MNLEGSEHSGTAGTVLVVEDDEAVAELVQITLARAGFDVDIVHTCADARTAIEDKPHDLLLLDIKLPDGDGLDLLTSFKDRGTSGAVIVLTAFRQEEKALRGFELGAADFISKPFKPREIVTRARHVLGLRDAVPVHSARGGR